MSRLRRLLNVFRPARVQREIDREIAFHLGERADQLRAEGVSEDEARRRARIQFGNPRVQAERTRDVDIALWVEAFFRNLRHAVRALARTPGFTVTVVLTLALGIGANTAVFSAIDGILLRPLPFPDGDRLVRLSEVRRRTDTFFAALPRLEDWNRLNATFEAISGYNVNDGTDTSQPLPERTRFALVAPRFLEVLGVAPALGRGLLDDAHRLGTPTTLLLSDRFWRNSYAADPTVPGRTVRVQDVSGDLSFLIAGVMSPSFLFLDREVGAWSAIKVDAPWMQGRQPGMAFWTAIGRLKPGVTLEQARADLANVQRQLGEQYPETDRDMTVGITPLKDVVVGDAGGSLWLLFGAVSVLLLIACTNIAALMLARGAQREEEVGVRYSLGASRVTVAAQMLTESAVLACAGAAAGLLVATGTSAALRRLAPNLPRLDEVGIDGRILLYTMAAAVAVSLLCGVFPAIRSSRGRETLARASGARVAPRHSLQWLLVGVQVALSVTLLAGAGLLLRSFEKLSEVNPGFDAARVLVFHIYGAWGEASEPLLRRITATLDAARTVPGVEVAATTTSLPGVPVAGAGPTEFTLADERAAAEPPLTAVLRFVSPSYFAAVGIPVVAGEMCRPPMTEVARRSAGQVMVNRTFAERYFPGRSVIGLHLTPRGDYYAGRIVGIVANARESGVDREPPATVYACDGASTPNPWYLVRTTGEPDALAGAIRLKMKEVEPLRAVYEIAPLQEQIDGAYAQNRLRTVLLLLFAATALSLACLGIYGTLSYVVRLRRREVGLRLALGAGRTSVMRQFLGKGIRVAGLACVCGLALSIGFTRLLSGMLFGVSPSDPITLSSVVAIVLAVAALAALVPAARVAFIDPMRVLRED